MLVLRVLLIGELRPAHSWVLFLDQNIDTTLQAYCMAVSHPSLLCVLPVCLVLTLRVHTVR